MGKPIGYYKKDGKTRPITSRKASVHTMQRGTAHLKLPKRLSFAGGRTQKVNYNVVPAQEGGGYVVLQYSDTPPVFGRIIRRFETEQEAKRWLSKHSNKPTKLFRLPMTNSAWINKRNTKINTIEEHLSNLTSNKAKREFLIQMAYNNSKDSNGQIYPQYKGYYDNWELGVMKKNWSGKGGITAYKGETVIFYEPLVQSEEPRVMFHSKATGWNCVADPSDIKKV